MRFSDPVTEALPGSGEKPDPGEFAGFLKTYNERLISHLRDLGADPVEADDLAAETFSRAARQWSTIRDHSWPWLAAVASSTYLWYYESKKSKISHREFWPPNSFISQLPNLERARLLDAGTPLRFEDEQILLVQGDVGDFLYVVVGGLVKVIVGAASGAQTTLAIRSRGDLVGEFSVLDNKPRTSTVRAAGPVTALKVDSAAFLATVGRSPEAQAALTKCLLDKMRASTERRAAERIWEARERLAQVLYELGDRHAEPDADGMIRIPLTQGEVGELAGIAVATAERVMKDLRKKGAVSTRYREITIRDMAYLDSIRFPRPNPDSPG